MHLLVVPHQKFTKFKILDTPTHDSWEIDGKMLDTIMKKFKDVYVGGRFDGEGALYAVEPADALAIVRPMLGETTFEEEMRKGKEGWKNFFKMIFFAMTVIGCIILLFYFFMRGIIMFFIVLCLAFAFGSRRHF